MAGPRPMQQPPGYGQPQQVIYVQQPQKSGFMKGCIIAFVVLLVLGVLAAGGIGFAIYKGAEYLSTTFTAEAEAATKITDDFMAKIGKGDFKGAYDLCEADKIKDEDLENFYNAYKDALKGNKGLSYHKETVPLVNISLVGAPYIYNDEAWIQMFPATITGGDAKIAFLVHRKGTGSPYKIKWMAITGAKVGTEGKPEPIGDATIPHQNSGWSTNN
ncbi:MAG: hypothetical protein IT462_16790 [Planctomycetes bacterium]|nr:hypothetical protein [Planctomycetota bacterium]